MQTETGRKTLLATTAAANLTLSATTAMWPERAAQAQASAPAGVTTNGGTIRMITQERAFTLPIWCSLYSRSAINRPKEHRA